MCGPVALFSFLFSRLQRGTRVLCGTKVTVTKRSCSRPPPLSLTCRDYVCVYTSGSVFTLHPLHPPLPPSNQLFCCSSRAALLLLCCCRRCRCPPSAADFCTRSPRSNQQMACQAAAPHRTAVCPTPPHVGGVQSEIGGSAVLPSDGGFSTHLV